MWETERCKIGMWQPQLPAGCGLGPKLATMFGAPVERDGRTLRSPTRNENKIKLVVVGRLIFFMGI